jgi:sporulation protein YlmC with PRC-barrel domain
MSNETPPIFALSALKGFDIVGSDGRIGKVKDFLFLDDRWKVRWLVVDIGGWLSGRKALIHPSAIADMDYTLQEARVPLTRQQVEGSPDIRTDEKLSNALEARLFAHYGWDPDWGRSLFAGIRDAPPALPGAVGESVDDPHLRSFEAIKGYRLRATDGEIGNVENFLIDRDGWNIRYLIVGTGKWWFGKEVLLAPYAVAAIDWLNREILLNVTGEQVKSSPPWDPLKFVDAEYGGRLHQHYGWPAFQPYGGI